MATLFRCLVALLMIAAMPLAAQRRGGERAPLRGFDAWVQRALADWTVPGVAVAVVKDDSVVYARGFGVRRLGDTARVTDRTLFAVGSTTKAFTAAALAVLVDSGLVKWDDPVSQHLPGFQLHDPYVTREMRVRDLLTHRSGLARGDGPELGRLRQTAAVRAARHDGDQHERHDAQRRWGRGRPALAGRRPHATRRLAQHRQHRSRGLDQFERARHGAMDPSPARQRRVPGPAPPLG